MSLIYVLIGIILSIAACHSQNILNISCCSGNDFPDHSCPPSNQLSLDNVLEKFQKLPPDSVLQLTNGICKLTHPLIFTGVSNIIIRGQGYQYTHISCNHMNAGLVFNNSFDIELCDFTINSCGVTDSEEKDFTGNASKSIIILNTVGIELQRLVIMNSHGYGVSIKNSFGNVLLHTLKFLNNGLASTGDELAYTYGGGGLAVVFVMKQSNLTNYNISNCTFYNNSAGGFNETRETINRYDFENTKVSGGINLHFHNDSKNIRVTIHSCNFTHNHGTAGGGLYVRISKNSSDCNVTVLKSEFFENYAEGYEGGGACANFIFNNQNLATHNSVLFRSVVFENNAAYLGGGAKIITNTGSDIVDYIEFDNCSFTNNSASGGAAIYIDTNFVLHGIANSITQVAFNSVSFSANFLNLANHIENAVILTCEVKVTFAGDIIFTNNQATTLNSASALLVFKPYITVKFSNNSGDRGGAILLTGESYMQLGSNIHFEFFNNSAASYGGAICVLPTHVHEFSFSDKCFLYSDSKFNNVNVSFTFDRNAAATGIGSNIFATSLHPCLELCQYQKKQ